MEETTIQDLIKNLEIEIPDEKEFLKLSRIMPLIQNIVKVE